MVVIVFRAVSLMEFSSPSTMIMHERTDGTRFS
jgi:hypothetical protein